MGIKRNGKRERDAALEREFLAAYDENADALFRHCLVRVRDRDLAKDIVQETFARTWTYVSGGQKVDHFRAFLYRTLHNAIVDTMRKKRTASLDAMSEEDGYEVPDESYEPDAATREESRSALKLLGKLDDIYRAVVTLRFIEGLTPGEIAKTLKVSENVVSVRIHRGLKQLREIWEAETAAINKL